MKKSKIINLLILSASFTLTAKCKGDLRTEYTPKDSSVYLTKQPRNDSAYRWTDNINWDKLVHSIAGLMVYKPESRTRSMTISSTHAVLLRGGFGRSGHSSAVA